MGVNTVPCGAYADLKELEYISALHQTGKNELRKDGSINAIDIVHFLMSRYGIKVTEEEVKEKILGAFGECSRRSEEGNSGAMYESTVGCDDGGGGGIKSEGDCLDLTQVLALLLVPVLLKAEQTLVQEKQPLSNTHSLSPHNENESPQIPGAESLGITRPLLARHSTALHREKGEKRWPDSDLIDNVLRMIMHDATGDPNPRPLTKGLIQQILCFYGEGDLSNDERLLDEMMMAAATVYSSDAADAATDIEGNPLLFDQHAFARALTHDVQQYDIGNENRVTTNYYDVFQTSYSTKEPDEKKLCHRLTNPIKTVESGCDDDTIQPVQRVFTFPSIDYTAGTYRSRGFVVCLWMSWILTYFAYLDKTDALTLTGLNCNSNDFGCQILQGIVNWLTIMAQLSILGTTFILWASIGNSVHPTNPMLVIFGMGAVILFVILPYFKDFNAKVFSTDKAEDVDSRVLYTLSLVCGFALLLASFLNLCQRVQLKEKLSLPKSPFVERLFTPGTIRLESQTKKAASFKANQLVRNAYKIHKTAEFDCGSSNGTNYETKYGNALLTFMKTADKKESLGGFLQTWTKIYSQQLFEEDGICFSTHLLAGNVAQCTICLIVGALFANFYQVEMFQEGLKYLDNIPGLGSQRWRLMFALFFGVICSEMAIIIIAVNYIPSSVRTMLQYRSGGYDSLFSKQFLKLRFAVDQSTLIFGSIFWGSFYTAVMIGIFSMLVMGVLLWPDFAQITLFIFANIIGIVITMLLKWLVLIGIRRKYEKAYYRRSVSLTNFIGVILESWNLGLTTSYMIIRGFKLLIAAALFIGRVDVPFLSEDACFLGPFELDAYPLMFRKDLLAHEAHKHPYLERIGVMYMMKLRHKNFGSYAGTCWRLMFVYALMPWMRKYRNSEGKLAEFRFAANRMWTGRMPTQTVLNESDVLMSSRESDGSKESGDSIAALRLQNQMLKKQNEMMRSLLFQNRNGKEIFSSCPPIIFSEGSPADLHASNYTL